MKEKGQALIILIVGSAVAISVLTAAILASIGQIKNSRVDLLGRESYYAAEAGGDYSLLKMMRDPSSCAGTENLTIGGISIANTYTLFSGVCTIVSKATSPTNVKSVRVQGSYDPTFIFKPCCWSEIP